MRPYEVMFIIDSAVVADDAVDSYIERAGSVIVQHGGKVTGVDKWGKRRFAYEIKGRTEGYYVVMTFQGTREGVAELGRVLRLTDNVIRHLIVCLDEDAKATAEQPDNAAEAQAAPEPAASGAEEAPSAPSEAGASEAEPGEAVATEAAEATT